MPSQGKELQLQHWLNENVRDLVHSIGNLESYYAALEKRLENVNAESNGSLLSMIGSAIQGALDEKVFRGIEAIKAGSSLVSLGQQFSLIDSDLPGPNPAADILALQTESAAYVIIEVKVSASAAREAITELSAYGRGLGNRYLGLNSFDAIWMIISTDFRPTLKEAIAYHQLISDRCIIPIMADVEWGDAEVSAVRLNIVETQKLPAVCATDALFSNAVFDGLSINFPSASLSPDVALHFISSACTRFGATGFCFQVRSEAWECAFPYPFGIYVATLNPFKLYRMSAFLNQLEEDSNWKRGTSNYEKAIFDGPYDSFDVDLTDFQPKWASAIYEDSDDDINFAGIPFDHSLFELSIRETNSQTIMFRSIFDKLLRMHGDATTAEIGGTDFPSMFFPHGASPIYHEGNIANVRYFGVLHDVVANLIVRLQSDPQFSGQTFGEIYESAKLLLYLISIGRPANLTP